MLNADLKEFNFTSDFDGLSVSAIIAVPIGNINGVVQIVHGMCEYKERYITFMDYLAEEGFLTVIHDNRGHGKSICSEEDLGFLYRNGGKGFVEDIAQLARITKESYPDLPYFMIGHSMGSLGARVFTKEHDSMINGLVVCGCPCFLKYSAFIRNISKMLSKKYGSHFRSEKITAMMEKMYNKPFAKENTPHSWVCGNPEVVAKYNEDPLCNFMFTLNGYEGLLYLIRECYSKKGWRVENPHLPIRFVSGKNDPCMISEKHFFKAIALMEKVGYESVSHRLFDGMRHEILNEKNNSIVYKDIAKTPFSWIDRIKLK